MKKRLPIGVSNFKKIIEENYYYADKSLFIKEILDDGSEVILLPRPRRFGKTLNMSMLRYFFQKTDESNISLFEHLEISKHPEYMQKQGLYPVIYLTFKDVKFDIWQNCFKQMQDLLSMEFKLHRYLLTSDKLDDEDKKYIQEIINKESDETELCNSLKKLSMYLSLYHGKKTVILIDEYDVPIQSGFIHGYYDSVVSFIRNLLSGGLKDNDHLEKSVLTGILRIAKESIFSGLNNLNVCTLLNDKYSNWFGLLEVEVEELLKYFNIEYEIDKVKNWYNGYIFGNCTIYNPWSIINYTDKHSEGFMPYWINTSSNDLVKRIITKGGDEVKQNLERLIKGESIEKQIQQETVMSEIEKSSEHLWSFLLFCGYLKPVKKISDDEGNFMCELKIPNLEVRYLYKQIITGWFSESINNDKLNLMLKSLTNGDIKTFGKILKDFVLKTLSMFDPTGMDSEKVYHSFVLGLLVYLNQEYEVKSNRESGFGRYDITLFPRDISKNGIIIEFKKVDHDDKETLETACNAALTQIEERKYDVELLDRGVKNIIKLGIAFEGKNVLIKQQEK